jgi:plastocyanin
MIVLMLGCQSMQSVTRTGEVKDIIIGDKLSSGELAVSPGDEVRWVNKRTSPVRVLFLDPIADKQLPCKDNFGGWMTPSDTAKLDTNETASACFRDPGYVRYTVRMQSGTPTGETNVAGVVRVGGLSGQATGMSGQAGSGETNSTTTTTTTTITTPSNR